MLPIIRTFISLPAGVARMPFWRFTAFTLAGCVPWVLMLAIVGREVGDNWEKWRHNLAYLDYLVLVAVGRPRRLPDPEAATGRRPGEGERGRGRRGGRGGRAGGRRRRLSEVAGAAIPARRAAALGIVQGPAELLPVSSSAHIVLLPWLAGWDWERLDPEVRKSFEVALHAGAAAALLLGQRRVIAEELRALRPPARLGPRSSPSCRRRSPASSGSGRSSAGWAGRGRPPPG